MTMKVGTSVTGTVNTYSMHICAHQPKLSLSKLLSHGVYYLLNLESKVQDNTNDCWLQPKWGVVFPSSIKRNSFRAIKHSACTAARAQNWNQRSAAKCQHVALIRKNSARLFISWSCGNPDHHHTWKSRGGAWGRAAVSELINNRDG